MIIHKQGDLFTSDAPVLAHGINCKGAMASGIAREFKRRYPDMEAWYVEECKALRIKPSHIYVWSPEDGPLIANVASQYNPGADARYDWTLVGLGRVVEFCEKNGLYKFAMPLIGCGVGGLNWDVMETKIQNRYGDKHVDIEVWTL